MKREIITVTDEWQGVRLDIYLCQNLRDISRSYGVKLIESGYVTKDSKPLNKKYKVNAGDAIEVCLPDPEPLDVVAEKISLDIIYEDDDLLVVNKPQGMVVHPAAGNYSGTLVNALMNHCKDSLSGINGVMRPGIVHRLDKDTSGLLLVAKNDVTHLFLSQQLKNRIISRIYLALVNGNPKLDAATINAPIGRNPNNRKKMSVTTKNSREAITHYRVLERFGKYALLECKLETGRTHQIRVHLAYIGHSIVGDKTYGKKKEEFKLQGQLLHAIKIQFIHPKTNEWMTFSAPIPDYFEKILNLLRD